MIPPDEGDPVWTASPVYTLYDTAFKWHMDPDILMKKDHRAQAYLIQYLREKDKMEEWLDMIRKPIIPRSNTRQNMAGNAAWD